MDFKGWWRAGNGQKCEPFTVRDAHSRFVLAATLLPGARGALVRDVLEQLFHEQGTPRAIQCDNGSPFVCTRARGGLTQLSAWLVSLGIRLIRAYSENNPLSKQDPDGRIVRQYRRDGKGNEIVRQLEAPLRRQLIDDCAAEADKNLNDCEKSAFDKCPPLPQNPSPPDARRRDEEMLKKMLECEKSAQCEYEACLAGATSGSGTADWVRAWTRCWATP
jgi:hypothetical protein